MRYLSLFSGVEAASVAWMRYGWKPLAFAEIDAFPSAVLANRFPDVPNLGDVCKVDWEEFYGRYGAVELLVGGSPCTSFSIAGNRECLEGESRLMFEYIRAVRDLVRASGGTRGTSSGRMSPEAFRVTRGETSDAYSMPWKTAGMAFRGERWTRNLPEFATGRLVDSSGRLRNAAGVSSLSEFLEARTPQRYCLSAKACEGIIRRAEKRGKALPETLKKALEQAIARDSSSIREAEPGT